MSPDRPRRLGRPALLRRPEEGWASLALLLGMVGVVGAAIADTWSILLGEADRAGWLVVLMVIGCLVGFVVARSPLGLVSAHIVGAAVAALILLLMAAAALTGSPSILPADLMDLQARVSHLFEEVGRFISPVRQPGDPAATRFLLLGAICWTTAQFSAVAVFRHGRAGPAVLATGITLFLDLSLGAQQVAAEPWSVVPWLAAYAALAMLLIVRLQLNQQGYQWARRHIADTGEVGRQFLRAGILFVSLAVTGAAGLTIVATAPSQNHHLGSLEGPLESLGAELSSWLSLVVPGPEPRPAPDRFLIGERWRPGEGLAFTAEVPGGLLDNYWWGWALDRFDGRQWDRQASEVAAVAAGEPLFESPAATSGGEEERASMITVDGSVPQRLAFGLAQSVELDVPVSVTTADRGGSLAEVRFQRALRRGATIRVDSRVRDYSGDTLTADELREAVDDYPAWVREHYLQGRGTDVGGPLTRQLAAEIMAVAFNPYDQAVALQRHLHDMEYREDITGLCGDLTWPECVLTHEQGFCSQYASTMVMVLREMGIPARFITGYLPGTELEDGSWEVEQAAFHNWAEAWFPGHGWIRFDPTPGRAVFGQTMTEFPEEEPDPPDDTEDGFEPPDEPEPEPEPTPDEALAPVDPTDGSPPDDYAATILLAGALAVLSILALGGGLLLWLRRLSDADGGLAYRGIVSLATRLGHGPHPSQTELEYAASLSETLPSVRDDLYVVAGARVDSAYGRRGVEPDRRAGLRRAYARVRTALLRLSLRMRR